MNDYLCAHVRAQVQNWRYGCRARERRVVVARVPAHQPWRRLPRACRPQSTPCANALRSVLSPRTPPRPSSRWQPTRSTTTGSWTQAHLPTLLRGSGDAAAAQGARHAHTRRPRRARLHHAAPDRRGVVRGRHLGLRRTRAARRVLGHEQRRRRPCRLGGGRQAGHQPRPAAPALRQPARRCARGLAQYHHARRVPPETLLETGLRAEDLRTLGITATRLRQDTLATDAQLLLLGF